MNIENYDLSNEKELLQLCRDAAEGCYYPATSQRNQAMSMVIQNLVLPFHVGDFDVDKMANFIYTKLVLKAVVRSVRDGKK